MDPKNALSRAAQEPAFRAFNRMVRKYSSISQSPEAVTLIEQWYERDLVNNTFNGDVVPRGSSERPDYVEWADAPNVLRDQQDQLYKKLVAVACRTCHISYVPFGTGTQNVLKLAKFTDVVSLAALVKLRMCSSPHRQAQGPQGIDRSMPGAVQTLKVLWRSAGRPHFFGQSGYPLHSPSCD